MVIRLDRRTAYANGPTDPASADHELLHSGHGRFTQPGKQRFADGTVCLADVLYGRPRTHPSQYHRDEHLIRGTADAPPVRDPLDSRKFAADRARASPPHSSPS